VVEPFDLSNINSIETFINEVYQKHGPIHVLVNNAGVEQYQHFDMLSQEDITSILKTNLRAPLELSRSILPKFIEQKSGHIINISSLAGKKGVAYNSIYSASKAGLLMWADGMRQEYKDSPIDISVICPGFISEAGMFYDGHVDPPLLLGSSHPQKVANAVLKALKKGSCELIVNSGPIRPLLALGQISWKLADKIVRWFGVPALSRKRISA
jgi:short-subunit dehydrogenase